MSKIGIHWKKEITPERASEYMVLVGKYFTKKMFLYSLYSQPFTSSMLIGENRLFKGFEEKEEDVKWYTNKKVVIVNHEHRFWFSLPDPLSDHIEFKTLDDFITLCKRVAKTELELKEEILKI